jgi:hypothetical protein
MITLESGLKNSFIVLEFLRDNPELKDISVSIGAFTNCRECGLTFKVMERKDCKTFTWCIYEHRNSDSIIINGKKGYISMSGDLPYKSDSKWDCIKSFDYNQHYECANFLAEEIVKFHKENSHK